MQALDLVERQAGAGRIVRIGEEDDFGLFRHRGKNCIDVGSEILLRRHHRLRAGAERHDRIDQEAMRGVDRLVAVDQIGVRKQMQQIVGAGAADDAIGIEPERAPDRLAQIDCRAVRIVLKVVGGGLIGRDRASGSARAASRSTTVESPWPRQARCFYRAHRPRSRARRAGAADALQSLFPYSRIRPISLSGGGRNF